MLPRHIHTQVLQTGAATICAPASTRQTTYNYTVSKLMICKQRNHLTHRPVYGKPASQTGLSKPATPPWESLPTQPTSPQAKTAGPSEIKTKLTHTTKEQITNPIEFNRLVGPSVGKSNERHARIRTGLEYPCLETCSSRTRLPFYQLAADCV